MKFHVRLAITIALCGGLLPRFGQASEEPTVLRLQRVAGEMNGGSVLDLGAQGAFDAAWATCPTVLHDGAQYRMWYSSYYDRRLGRGGIGMAVSPDGIHWQRANEGQAVLTPGEPGSLDAGQVMGPCVLATEDGYLMWYTGMDDVADGQRIGRYRIFAAQSRDGIHWQRLNGGLPVLDLGPPAAADAVQAATPAVLRDDRGYRMWYAAWSTEQGHTICSARSPDGISWQREGNGKPVTGLPAECYGPEVCRWNGGYLMLFMRTGAERRLLAAHSSDGRTWTMLNGGQPVIPAGGSEEFDAYMQGHPAMLVEQDRLRVWYTGYRREAEGLGGLRLRIGMAESKLPEGDGAATAANPPRPNILFLYGDDLGYGDLACYGSEVARTPHLDRLATQGTRYMQFYVSHCVCSPTRASAITGQFPARHRIYGHLAHLAANQRRQMPNYLAVDAPSLPRALQAAGYRTAMIGKWHLGGGSGQVFQGKAINDPHAPPVKDYGFDWVRVTFGNGPTWKQAEPVPQPHEIYPYLDDQWQRYSSRSIAEETMRFLEEHVARHKDRPFYANVWFKDAHTPFNPTPEMLAPFANLPEPARSHYAMIHYMDSQIGRILERLEELGLAHSTLVLFASDNGAVVGRGGSNGPLREGKHTLYEGGIRMPLIARWPGRVPAGRVDTESLLNVVDFVPTFTRLAGAKMPGDFRPDGEDISAALRGQPFLRSRPMFWHQLPNRKSPELAVRRGRWKLAMTSNERDLQLYDLQSDASESNNLAAQQPEVVAELRTLLSEWYEEIRPQPLRE